MFKKFAPALIGLALLAGPLVASALTPDELQQQINQLLQQIQQLQQLINQLQGGNNTTQSCVVLAHNMGAGDTDAVTGGEVMKLQRFLASDPSIYPEGLVTGFFGPATEHAVQRYQAKYSIVTGGTPETTGYGFVGPKTREYMARGCTGGTSQALSLSVVSVPQSPMNIGQTGSWIVQSSGAAGAVTYSATWGDGQSTVGQYAPTFSHAYSSAGTYTPAFSATSGGAYANANAPTLTIVGPTAQTPACTLSAAPASISSGQSSTLAWSSTNATGGTISNIGSVSTSGSQTVSPSQTTIYTGTFTGQGGTATCQTTVTVAGSNTTQPVIAIAQNSLTSTTAAATIRGTASGTNTVRIIVSLAGVTQWDSGPAAVTNGAWSVTTLALSNGVYIVNIYDSNNVLRAIGALSVSATAATSITALSASPQSGSAPLSVTFAATGTNLSGASITFGDGAAGTLNSTGSATHTYATSGTYAATAGSAVAMVTVSGQSGGSSAYLTVSPSSGAAPLTVTATLAVSCDGASANGPWGACVPYWINWGDGHTDNISPETFPAGPFPPHAQHSHTYTTGGSYTVSSNSFGSTNSATVTATAQGGSSGNACPMVSGGSCQGASGTYPNGRMVDGQVITGGPYTFSATWPQYTCTNGVWKCTTFCSPPVSTTASYVYRSGSLNACTP